MSPARARTRTARSGDEGTNHEATAPPRSNIFGEKINNKISNIFNSMKIENKPGCFGFDDNYISFSFLPRFVIWERKGDLVD